MTGVSEFGRTPPYAAAPGCGPVSAVNGKLLLKPGPSGLIQNKSLLTGGRRPTIAIPQIPGDGDNVQKKAFPSRTLAGNFRPNKKVLHLKLNVCKAPEKQPFMEAHRSGIRDCWRAWQGIRSVRASAVEPANTPVELANYVEESFQLGTLNGYR